MKQKVCPYCAQEFIPSRFHQGQVVCSSSDCQRRRRADYHRRKLAEDPEYRAQCKDSKAKWKEDHPSYPERYRAMAKKGDGARHPHSPSIDDLLRLLRHAKNTSAKNNSAFCVTSRFVEVLCVSLSGARSAKNTFAACKVIVVEQDPGSDI
ncbi:MAG: hypothetical protein ABSC08_20200 [Bryobacteraceae bacterium]|jgi:hypothetical protein